jgi:diguanylate cyclase (GGDEF)-like protein
MKSLEVKGKGILIIDDQSEVRRWIVETLREKGIFTKFYEANDGMEGFKILNSHDDIDLIVCDLVMEKFDGIKFLTLVSNTPKKKDIPIIMLTSVDKIEDKVKALESGAQDYITKPIDPRELIARIKVHLKLKITQDRLNEINQTLEHLSRSDPLTGVYNRRFLLESLEAEFERAKRYSLKFSVILMDIDNFKEVNDKFGHIYGDKILQQVAQILREELRRHDILGRYGGDEFLIILPETDNTGAGMVGERCRKAIYNGINFADENYRLTVSMGIISYPNPKIITAEDMIRLADTALYEAKARGKNKVVIAK